MSDHILATPFGFYFRMTVPKELRAILGKREIKKSLSTHSKSCAIKLARVLMCEVDALITSVRENSMTIPKRPSLPGLSEMVLRTYRPDGTLLKEFDGTPEEFKTLSPKDRADFQTKPSAAIASAILPKVIVPIPTSPTLQARIDDYLKEKVRYWVQKTHNAERRSLHLLVEYFGDVPMDVITRKMASEFIDVLSKLPPRHNTTPKYMYMTLQQLAMSIGFEN